MRNLLRRVVTVVADTFRGPSPSLIPPDELMEQCCIGPANAVEFVACGEWMMRRFVLDTALVRPEGRLLDVGCGLGQLARPLTRHLSARGCYEGFDVNPDAIRWCQEAYRRHRNFRFQSADVYNRLYHPAGKHMASDYEFPYPANSFDAVLLTSVFTHMLPQEVRRYFAEITRVLKPGGRCVSTYFLLNPEALQAIESGQTTPTFPFAYGSEGCRIENEDCPEEATAHEEAFLRALHDEYGLQLEQVNYGEWCRGGFIVYQQDALTAVKQ